MFHRRNWETVSGLGDQAERAFAHGDFSGGLSLLGEADVLTADLAREPTGDLFTDNGESWPPEGESEGFNFDAPPAGFPHRVR